MIRAVVFGERFEGISTLFVRHLFLQHKAVLP
jgi:hypothetical protein